MASPAQPPPQLNPPVSPDAQAYLIQQLMAQAQAAGQQAPPPDGVAAAPASAPAAPATPSASFTLRGKGAPTPDLTAPPSGPTDGSAASPQPAPPAGPSYTTWPKSGFLHELYAAPTMDQTAAGNFYLQPPLPGEQMRRTYLSGMTPAPAPGSPETTQDNLTRDQILQQLHPAHETPVSYHAPPLWQRLLFGLSAAAAGWRHPEVGANLVERYNANNQEHADEAAAYNRQIPQANQAADDKAVQQYLSGQEVRANVRNIDGLLADRARQAQNQRNELASRTVNTDQGVMAFNPDSGHYDVRVGGNANPKNLPVVATDHGYMVVDPVAKTVTPLTLNGQALMEPPPKTLPAPHAGTVDGKPASAILTPTGWQDAATGEPLPKFVMGAPQQPSFASIYMPVQGAGKLTTETENWNKASGDLETTLGAIQQARTGDELANNVLPMMGALMTTGAGGVHRINSTEVAQFGSKLGSLARQINTALDKAGKGALPPETVGEMQQLATMYRGVLYRQYLSRAQAIAQNYQMDPAKVSVTSLDGKQALPLSQALKGLSESGTVRMRAPNGQEQDVPSDQVDHFKQLGAVEVNHG